MNTEAITLIAATIAAATSIITLLLNSRLTILREKRILRWQKELDRIFDLEEIAGMAKDISINHHDAERLKKYFIPIYDELDGIAGHLGRYSGLSSAIHSLKQLCAAIVDAKINKADFEREASQIEKCYRTLLSECDKITMR